MTLRLPSTSASEPGAERGSPRALLASVWALSVLLTLLHVKDLRSDLSESQRARWLERPLDQLLGFADRVGLAALAAQLQSLRAALYGVSTTPPPPPVIAQMVAKQPTSARVLPQPSRVLLVGASSIQFAIGQALEQQLTAYQGLEIWRFGKASTGLARPEEFNWPARLEQLLDQHHPDLVIANFGGNDAQNIPLPRNQRVDFGSDDWDKLYGERVADFVLRIRARGAQAVMIGMPLMRSPSFSKRMLRLNQVTQSATEAAGGVYLDQWDLAALPDGSYRERVDEGQKSRPMRLEDGIHYTDAGGRYVVAHLLHRLARHVRLVPKDATLGIMERHEFTSSALARPSSYLAWLPRLSASERVPLLILLHGANASPDELAEHMHAELQAVAQSQHIAIVAPNGGAAGWWLDSPERANSRYGSLVAEDVVADARANLPVNSALGVMGISMGGNGALALALMRPGLFRSASSVSGAVDLTLAADRPALAELLGPLASQRARWEDNSAAHLLAKSPRNAPALRFSCGMKDRWISANRALHASADALHVAHVYDEAPQGHEWSYWQRIVPEHVAWHAQQLGSR